MELSKVTITELTKENDNIRTKLNADLDAANNKAALLAVDNTNLKETLNKITNQSFDNADGQVVRVAAELDTVFIDIGRSVGLTNNRTFAVYDQSVINFKTATPKASIEVVQVGSFDAEARITDENPVDPILKGDHILNPVWDPGFSLKLALAGRFDLDGDRYDDTEKLIRIIERNGGTVVAKHDDKGNVTGKISPEVRYLVKGNEELINGDDDPNAGKILNALRNMEADAIKNTVQVIDLQKLLNQLGISAQPKTTQLDFPSDGFPKKPADGFQKRQPGEIRGSGSSTRSGPSTR